MYEDEQKFNVFQNKKINFLFKLKIEVSQSVALTLWSVDVSLVYHRPS